MTVRMRAKPTSRVPNTNISVNSSEHDSGRHGEPYTGKLVFPRIKRRRAFEEISDKIKQMIFSGVLKPGSRLPSETELASQFGVGRQTIREALRLLELSGFIGTQTKGAGGPVVVDTILDAINNSFIDFFRMKQITIGQVTSARVQIEKMVITDVIKYSEDQDIKLLRANLVDAQNKATRGIQLFEDNIRFHKLLAKASKNPVFIVIMEAIAAVLSHIRSLSGMDLELSSQACHEHEEILAAIEKREESKALELIELHMSHVEKMHKSLVNRRRKLKDKKGI